MRKLRINFILPPANKISGGPLAILEYAERLIARGHKVTITTYPKSMWENDSSPFPWFQFSGEYIYPRMEGFDEDFTAQHFLNLGRDIFSSNISKSFEFLFQEPLLWKLVTDVIPECDLNIATFWSTAYIAYLSGKGKPIYFMQHYEEVFYPDNKEYGLFRRLCSLTYDLPIYKVANSSWLKNLLSERHGLDVPFSNNALELDDFTPTKKLSEDDGVIRVITYSRPEIWKGFADAVYAMSKVRKKTNVNIEWNVFGYLNHELPPNNSLFKYTYHEKLPFTALSALYAKSDIALCPSWYESFPLPPLEAMASGTAAITTRFGTEDYAFDNINSLVCNSRDTEGMSEAVLDIILDSSKRNRLAQAGRETSLEFTWENAVNKREKILIDIFDGRVSLNSAGESPLYTDYSDTSFSRGPIDCNLSEIFWNNGHLFMAYNGVKYCVSDIKYVKNLLDFGFKYTQKSAQSIERMPYGDPIDCEFRLYEALGK